LAFVLLSDGKLDARDILMRLKLLASRMCQLPTTIRVERYKQLDFADKDINLIKGVEFDCWERICFMQILGIGVDINDKALIEPLCQKKMRPQNMILSELIRPEVPEKLFKQ
jgi:hypothetical protein